MKRALLVHPQLTGLTGANQVAAWILEALRGYFDLSVLTVGPVDWEHLDRYYGTSLRGAAIAQRRLSAASRTVLQKLPLPAAALQRAWLARTARRLDAREGFDVLISADNEMDFGRRGIQYVHFPAHFTPRPPSEGRWYHRSRLATAAYRAAVRAMAGESRERIRQNLTLVNSTYIGEKFSAVYGCKGRVLHPPVLSGGSPRPWSERRDGIVCLGRVAPEKEIEKVVGVVEALRACGHALELHLVGEISGRYAPHIRPLLQRHAGWVIAHGRLERPALDRIIAENRYGIHGMVGEHFGIGVAEMQSAGCIVFAPDLGGPVEILGADERLLYADAGAAVEKIEAVLGSLSLQRELLAEGVRRSGRFSEHRFATEMREIVLSF